MSHKIVYEKWTFPADKIREGNLYLATSLLSSSLEVNTLNATVECADPSILDFQRNAQLLYYAQPDRPMVFRVQNITRIAPSLYELSCTSTLGLLTEGQHMGGIYTGQTAKQIIADICGNVPFIVKTNLENINLYGWLPIASPRDNLSQVLFAIGATLKTDLDGVLRIAGLWDGVSSTTDKDRMYDDGKVEYSAKVTQVVLTEHQYSEGGETKKLFEGTAQEGDIITFSAPMYDLSATGITIQARGANWARVSAGSGILNGKEYIHNTRRITRDVQTANTPNVKTVEKATLISLVNSAATADRLVSYFKCKETINSSVVYRGENMGNVISTYHPFDKNAVNACIQSADITLSNTLKAQEKNLVGFVPHKIQLYNHVDVILSDCEWGPPSGVSQIRIVLIGGGRGGQGGRGGEAFSFNVGTAIEGTEISPSGSSYDRYPSGGSPGNPGDGGKVFVQDIYIGNNKKFRINIGKGGKGGSGGDGHISNIVIQKEYGDYGDFGTETTFGDYSSESGSIMNGGFLDTINNVLYATDGPSGFGGAKGGATYGAVTDGFSFENWKGGKRGETITIAGSNSTNDMVAQGGAGGGAAYGAEGKDGTNAVYKLDATIDEKEYHIYSTGTPGRGATPIKAQKPNVPGQGGQGGHGGGGAGASAGGYAKGSYAVDVNYSDSGRSYGGDGGEGGDGADGAVLIYYYNENEDSITGQFLDKNGKHFLEKFTRRFIV